MVQSAGVVLRIRSLSSSYNDKRAVALPHAAALLFNQQFNGR